MTITYTILQQIANTWERRAQIKKPYLDDIAFDMEADDFLIELLPFKHHPLFLSASKEMQSKILSCGWIMYNQKTVLIENEIITPTCLSIIAERLPGLGDITSKQIANETMIDESYHSLLVLRAIQMTERLRNFSIDLPKLNFIQLMKREQSLYSLNWQKVLVQFVTAIISEIFISDYLKLLSDSSSVQPFNQKITQIHRDDELAHRHIFKYFAKFVYTHLSHKQKAFFATIFTKPIKWFHDREFTAWKASLIQIGFKDTERMLRDCAFAATTSTINYTELNLLAAELDLPIAFDA